MQSQFQWMDSISAREFAPVPPFITMRPKLDNDVPRFVEESQGQGGGWLGPLYDPFTIDHAPDRDDYRVGNLALPVDLTIERLENRKQLLSDLNRQLREQSPALQAKNENDRRAFELLAATAQGAGAFDLKAEPQAVRERYGLNPHGQSVLQARRLVEYGVPLVTVFWPNDGIKNVSVYWDTHSRNFVDLKDRLMPVADQAFSALLDDLQERGMLDDTLVVWGGEFGRTPRVGQRNSDAGAGRDGRDHWPGCFSMVLAGAGVKTGMVYGRSDRHAAYPADAPVNPAELVATLYHLLGVPRTLALPDVSGRPHQVRPAAPLAALLA